MGTCERAQAHLNDFLDGTLGAAQAQEINAHLQDCAACRDEYHALKTTQELVHNAAVPGGEEARRRVMAHFRQAVAPESGAVLPASPEAVRIAWRKRLLPYGAAVATAGVLCLAVLVPLHYSNERTTGEKTPVIIATASCTSDLPTADNLDQMASAHAVQSLTVQNGSEEMQQEALADANSRLSSPSTR
jgi:hypothetical protein